MTINIQGVNVSVKAIADFLSQMNSGDNDNGFYEGLILESEKKRSYISERFQIVRGHFDPIDLDEAFEVIEGQ